MNKVNALKHRLYCILIILPYLALMLYVYFYTSLHFEEQNAYMYFGSVGICFWLIYYPILIKLNVDTNDQHYYFVLPYRKTSVIVKAWKSYFCTIENLLILFPSVFVAFTSGYPIVSILIIIAILLVYNAMVIFFCVIFRNLFFDRKKAIQKVAEMGLVSSALMYYFFVSESTCKQDFLFYSYEWWLTLLLVSVFAFVALIFSRKWILH